MPTGQGGTDETHPRTEPEDLWYLDSALFRGTLRSGECDGGSVGQQYDPGWRFQPRDVQLEFGRQLRPGVPNQSDDFN